MLERHQTDVTHSVFTTSPTAYDKEHRTASPEARDQERKEKLGMFNSMNLFPPAKCIVFSLDSKMAIELTSLSL